MRPNYFFTSNISFQFYLKKLKTNSDCELGIGVTILFHPNHQSISKINLLKEN